MAAGNWLIPTAARTSLLNGTFNIEGDTFNMALFQSTSNIGAGSTTFAALTNEVGITNTGYTAGGIAMDLALSGTTTVMADNAIADPQWTAGSAGLVAHYAVIYEVTGNVLCYCFLENTGPADVTVTAGNTLTVAIHTDGVFTLAVA